MLIVLRWRNSAFRRILYPSKSFISSGSFRHCCFSSSQHPTAQRNYRLPDQCTVLFFMEAELRNKDNKWNPNCEVKVSLTLAHGLPSTVTCHLGICEQTDWVRKITRNYFLGQGLVQRHKEMPLAFNSVIISHPHLESRIIKQNNQILFLHWLWNLISGFEKTDYLQSGSWPAWAIFVYIFPTLLKNRLSMPKFFEARITVLATTLQPACAST